ncbi:hypothetical protein ERJ75_001004600 [Trypanosoma vivax]|uniref:Uncharacterized protein n=1 Tax=Trypanosoma vivax (strain Y486) TaxID=1055687 RepID=G0TYG4_TRYVY|nr:hypothetical protein TRVL_03436 [Trypanosoma vivax]KAH8611132.1 hypothetical protein ERJ75_001004600 [Trypanosoma vivax]CCC49011.1 conserved hypothetical protein [Trypanosoma vivax Y486]
MAQQGTPAKERPPLHVYPEAKVGTAFFSHHGIDSTRYNGICALTGSTVLMASGRFVMFVDFHRGTIESVPGPEDGGVGAVAVHPSKRFYVVCERALKNPLIRAYEWPSRVAIGEFSDGAVRGFSACSFNSDGRMMATVGMYPDFYLTVWNWETRGMILRNKCYGGEVYTVVFSPFDSGLLVTGGTGHIKFWSMAHTFTGMKLKGLLGKFGRLEISNVSGFVVLSDGKVVSGTESGLIVLWEGDLIRCCFARKIVEGEDGGGSTSMMARNYGYVPCHDGTINVVELVDSGRLLVTAGDDGYMRYWRVSELEMAEGEGAPPLYVPECLCEVLVDPGANIRAVSYCKDVNEWAVLDSQGALWRVPYFNLEDMLNRSKQFSLKPPVASLRFNGGSITSAALSPSDHTVVTGGEDASIRLIDYVTPCELFHMRLPQPNVVIGLRFFNRDCKKSKFLACCESGAVLMLERGETSFTFLGQWRPHNNGLKLFAVDSAERRLCTVSSSAEAFFFNIEENLTALQPIGFCRLPLPNAMCIAWDDANSCCLIGHECGKVLAIHAPTLDDVDQATSFEFKCRYSLVGIRQRKKVEKRQASNTTGEREEYVEEEEEEENVGPWPVHLIRSLTDGTFIVGAGSPELLYQYNLQIRYEGQIELPPLPATGIEPVNYVEEPTLNLCYRGCTPVSASISYSGMYLVILCEGSQMLLRKLDAYGKVQPTCILAAAAHDRLEGCVSAACTSFDDTMLVSVGSDGLVVAQLLSGCSPPSAHDQKVVPPPLSTLKAEEVVEPQITSLSICEQKDLDDRRRAEEEKQRELRVFLAKLSGIHEKYAALIMENSSAPEASRLSEKEMALHPQILEELQQEMSRRVEESRKPTALQLAREELRTKKMRDRFIDNLVHDRFMVQSFSKEFVVASFRTPKIDSAVKRYQAQIEYLTSSEGAPCASMATASGTESTARNVEENRDDASLATAAGIMQWLAAEEMKHHKLEEEQRQAESHRESEILTTTKRQFLDKLDERRQERHWRKKGYEMLLSHKPDPAEETARFDAELRQEVSRRGECVLRTDPSYHSSPSAVDKLREMIALEQLMFKMRNEFTEKLIKIRDDKKLLCETLNVYLQRIRTINEGLKDKSFPADDVRLSAEELSEGRFDVTRDDLDAFVKQRQEEKTREELAKKAQRGFGADLAGNEPSPGRQTDTVVDSSIANTLGSKPTDAEEERKVHVGGDDTRTFQHRRSKSVRSSTSTGKSSRMYSASALASAAVRERMDHELRVKLDNVKLTEMEEEEQQMERQRLLAERQRLHTCVRDLMDGFDKRLWEMLEERCRIDANLSLAHTRSLLLYREYKILLVFRQRDIELRQQYEEATTLRDQRRREVEKLQRVVEEQTASLEKLHEVNKTFRRGVEGFIAANFPPEHVPYITKVFLRQIKRRKNNGDACSADDDITSDDDDDEDVGEDDIWEEVCPPQCSEERWLEVIEKRETRLDHVDAIADCRRHQEATQQSIQKHQELAEKHDKAVCSSLKAIEDFQSEKCKQLNMLDTLVALRCSQVQCLKDGKCPETFRSPDIVVVSNDVIKRLYNRIEGMAVEKQELREKLKTMVSEQQTLQRERSAKQSLHAQWEEKIYEAMLLKFGQIVNLELLESSCGSREVEQLKERLRIEELTWEKEIQKREKKISLLREKLQDSFEQNTDLLHGIGDQESERQEIRNSFTRATQKAVSKMHNAANVATEEDRNNLRLLISAQQKEIESLQREVAMLRSKGGHVYAPTTS